MQSVKDHQHRVMAMMKLKHETWSRGQTGQDASPSDWGAVSNLVTNHLFFENYKAGSDIQTHECRSTGCSINHHIILMDTTNMSSAAVPPVASGTSLLYLISSHEGGARLLCFELMPHRWPEASETQANRLILPIRRLKQVLQSYFVVAEMSCDGDSRSSGKQRCRHGRKKKKINPVPSEKAWRWHWSVTLPECDNRAKEMCSDVWLHRLHVVQHWVSFHSS